jgi:hypothetical protein
MQPAKSPSGGAQADLSKLVHIKDCHGSQSLLHHIVRLLQHRAPGATQARCHVYPPLESRRPVSRLLCAARTFTRFGAPHSDDTAELPTELAAVRAMRKVCIDDLRSEVKKAEADMDFMTDASNEAPPLPATPKKAISMLHSLHPPWGGRRLSGRRWRVPHWRRLPKTTSRSRCCPC